MIQEDAADRIERALMMHRVIAGEVHASDEEDVIDFLTDLRHFCDREHLDLGKLDRIAHRYYLEDNERALTTAQPSEGGSDHD